jgi:hypothetical protein
MQGLYLPVNLTLSTREEYYQRVNLSLGHRLGQSASKPKNLEIQTAFDPNKHASEDVWNKAKCKGERLLAGMKATDEEAGRMFQDPRNPSTIQSDFKGDQKSTCHLRFIR